MPNTSSSLAVKYLERYRSKLLPLLDEFFTREKEEAKRIGKRTKEALEFLWEMTKKGKKVRGALTMLGYEIAGGKNKKKALCLGLALEIFHSAILIHDDILDRDTLRRGAPTCWNFWRKRAQEEEIKDPYHFGVSMAINTGDLGFYLAQKALRLASFSSRTRDTVNEFFEEILLKVVYGQILDISNSIWAGFSEKEILKVFYFKTALYTGSGPLLLGYKAGGGDEQNIENSLRIFGENIGWAFQLRDDILGVFGDPAKTGKSVGGDIREGKNNIVVLKALKSLKRSEREKILSLLSKKGRVSQKEIREIVRIIEKSESRQEVEKEILRYYKTALKEAQKLPAPFYPLLCSFAHLFSFREA